jgi:DNA replication protein DnaC
VPASKPTTEEQFEAFWRLYPRKVAKAAARKAWLRLVKDTKLADYVVLALRKQINAQEWLSKDVQFIPHATTWINQQRWEDEVVPANQPASAAPVFAGVR